MKKFTMKLKQVFGSKKGSIVETVVILAFIAVLCYATLTPLGTSVKSNGTNAVTKIDELLKITEGK